MSTRCTITVKVRKEDIGKIHKGDISMLHNKVCDFDGTAINIPSVTMGEYAQAFCLFDGYPDEKYKGGVGTVLKEHYTDYEKALNLVLCGNYYCLVCNKIVLRGSMPNYDWDKEATKMLDEYSLQFTLEEYNYLFDDGEWKVFDAKGKLITDFKNEK